MGAPPEDWLNFLDLSEPGATSIWTCTCWYQRAAGDLFPVVEFLYEVLFWEVWEDCVSGCLGHRCISCLWPATTQVLMSVEFGTLLFNQSTKSDLLTSVNSTAVECLIRLLSNVQLL